MNVFCACPQNFWPFIRMSSINFAILPKGMVLLFVTYDKIFCQETENGQTWFLKHSCWLNCAVTVVVVAQVQTTGFLTLFSKLGVKVCKPLHVDR